MSVCGCGGRNSANKRHLPCRHSLSTQQPRCLLIRALAAFRPRDIPSIAQQNTTDFGGSTSTTYIETYERDEYRAVLILSTYTPLSINPL